MDAFTPSGHSERQISERAAAGNTDAAVFSSSGQEHQHLTGYSPSADRNAENMSASQWNNTSPRGNYARISGDKLGESPRNSDRVAGSSQSDDEMRIARMEYLHQVCRILVSMIRNRGQFLKVSFQSAAKISKANLCASQSFLELLCCRLCEAAAFVPLAVTVHCEQILGSASELDPLCAARALAPYAYYGSGSVNGADAEAAAKIVSALPPPPDSSFSPSPTSFVRLLALRGLAQCIPQMTSGTLISVLPHLMCNLLPSFKSPLVDIRQAVVTVIVHMYVLVGDVLHPYVKDLPPQQKKLLTIYIDRQLKRREDLKNT